MPRIFDNINLKDEVHIAYATPHGQLDKLKFSTK